MSKKKIYKFKKSLPISCLCSIYFNTKMEEFSLSLKSLLFQKYIPNQIIVVVDGPIKKNLEKYLEKLTKKNKLIRVIRFKKNQGLGKALNLGLKYCDNDIVARFDSDDINLKRRLEIQYKYLIDNPEIDILGSYIEEFKIDENTIFSRLKKVPSSNKSIYKIMDFRNPLNHPSIIFKKKKILNSGSYISIQFFEDYHLWLRCRLKNLHFHNLKIPLVAMKREDSTTRRHGLNYAYCEFEFIKSCIKLNMISHKFIFFYLIRLLIRLIPKDILEYLFKFDFRRTNFSQNNKLTKYIKNLNIYTF